MSRSMRASLVAMVLLVLTGCAHTGNDYVGNNPFIPANYRAADALLMQLNNSLPAGNSTLIVATLVNIDALENSSTLGRLVSEQILTRFTLAGYRMIEMKFRSNIYMLQGQGELMLTREIHELASSHSAQAVIVGTYGESKDYIFVNLKVIQPQTNVVLAVHDYALPLDDNTRSMLRTKRY
jgi:TolB-like protein